MQPEPDGTAGGIAIAVRPVTRSVKRHITPPASEYTRVMRTSGLHCELAKAVIEPLVGRTISSIGVSSHGALRESGSTLTETKLCREKSPAPRLIVYVTESPKQPQYE